MQFCGVQAEKLSSGDAASQASFFNFVEQLNDSMKTRLLPALFRIRSSTAFDRVGPRIFKLTLIAKSVMLPKVYAEL